MLYYLKICDVMPCYVIPFFDDILLYSNYHKTNERQLNQPILSKMNPVSQSATIQLELNDTILTITVQPTTSDPIGYIKTEMITNFLILSSLLITNHLLKDY